MPLCGIIMESNFYKASLRPMGASAPTYNRACSPNRPMLCIWIVSGKINKLYQIRLNWNIVGADALIGPPFDRLTVKPFDRYILSQVEGYILSPSATLRTGLSRDSR